METVNQQMDDMLSQAAESGMGIAVPDSSMLEGQDEKTLAAYEDFGKGFAFAPVTTAADTFDLGKLATSWMSDDTLITSPTAKGLRDSFAYLSDNYGREKTVALIKDITGVELKDNADTMIGEMVGLPFDAVVTKLASGLAKGYDVARAAGPMRRYFESASRGDDLSGLSPAIAVGMDRSTVGTRKANNILNPELPDTSKTKMMVGESGSVGEDAIFRYQNLADEQPDLTKEELFAQTGVYRGRDGKLRHELDTQEAVLIGKQHPAMAGSDSFYTLAGLDRRSIADNKSFRIEALEDGDVIELGEVVDFPSLYNQYSDYEAPIPNVYSNKPFGADYDPIQHLQINIENFDRGGTVAYYSPESDTITISANLVNKPEEFLSVLLHEVQHAVQHREGFSVGSNVAMFYKRAGFELGYDDLSLDSAAAWESRWNKASVRNSSGVATVTKNFKQNSPVFNKDRTDVGMEDPATLMVMSLQDLFVKRADNKTYKKGKDYSSEERKNIFTLTEKDVDNIVQSEEFDELVSDHLKERVEKDLRSFQKAAGDRPEGLYSVFKDIVDGQVEMNRLMQIKQRARLNYERTYGELESRLVQERLGMRKKLAAEGYSTQEIRDIMAEKYPPVDMAINQYAVMDPNLDEGAKEIAEELLAGKIPEGLDIPEGGYPSTTPGNRGMGQLRVREDSGKILTEPDEYAGFNESISRSESAPPPRQGYNPADPASRVFHLTKKDFDTADVIGSGTNDIGFHVGTAAQANARGSTGQRYDPDLMEQMTKGERILPMVLKQNLKPARILDVSSFKEPNRWLNDLSVGSNDKERIRFLLGDPSDNKLLTEAPTVKVGGETRYMLPDAMRAGMDENLWKDLILEASRAKRVGLDTINSQTDRVQWFNTLKDTANKHGYDSFVYRNEYEGSDDFKLDELVDQINRANKGEIDPSSVDLNARFADSYMLLEPDQAKGIFGGMTEGKSAYMKNKGGLMAKKVG